MVDGIISYLICAAFVGYLTSTASPIAGEIGYISNISCAAFLIDGTCGYESTQGTQ